MKFVCQKDSLLKELSNASDFTAQRNTLTMLANVYLTLSQNQLTIKTTDQKMGYNSTIAVEGIEDGCVAVVCDKFSDIIRNLPSSNIVIEENGEKILIKPENSSIEFNLRTSDPSAFPVTSLPEDSSYFKIAQKDFTDMINQVSFAVSDDESKFAMNGALFERTDDSIIMVGTDGRRLSYINRKTDSEIPAFGNVTIPSKFLSIIKKHSTNEGDFEICVTDLSIFVRTSSFIIFSNLIKNEFPAYKRVIPENQTKSCTVNIKALEDAIKRVSLLVENKYKKIILEFTEGKLTLSTEESEIGSGKEEIACQYFGEEMRCAMNYTYLLSPLKVMEGDDAKIAFTESGRPFTLTTAPEQDYLHVIMPMNLN